MLLCQADQLGCSRCSGEVPSDHMRVVPMVFFWKIANEKWACMEDEGVKTSSLWRCIRGKGGVRTQVLKPMVPVNHTKGAGRGKRGVCLVLFKFHKKFSFFSFVWAVFQLALLYDHPELCNFQDWIHVVQGPCLRRSWYLFGLWQDLACPNCLSGPASALRFEGVTHWTTETNSGRHLWNSMYLWVKLQRETLLSDRHLSVSPLDFVFQIGVPLHLGTW